MDRRGFFGADVARGPALGWLGPIWREAYNPAAACDIGGTTLMRRSTRRGDSRSDRGKPPGRCLWPYACLAITSIAVAPSATYAVELKHYFSPQVLGTGIGQIAVDDFKNLVGVGFEHTPALILGLSLLLAVPLLVLVGLVLRWALRKPAEVEEFPDAGVTRRQTEILPPAAEPAIDSTTMGITKPHRTAWLEVENGRIAPSSTAQTTVEDGRTRYHFGRASMMRIGREADNEVCISEKTVHRYHAVIHRSIDDGRYTITDLSGEDGNGLVVNGVRLNNKRLANGDRIALGRALLQFHLSA